MIILDADESWGINDPNKFDVENVATHEFGHVAGLGHVHAPKDGLLTMYFLTAEGEILKRLLGSGDILGLEAL